MEQSAISFTHNYNNKLACEVFTTVRIENPKKFKPNQLYEILLTNSNKGEPISQGKARILLIQPFLLDKVSEGIALIDTGLTRSKFIELVRTIYKNTGIDFTSKRLSLIFLKYE
jgi:hypothetical protein